MDYDPQWPILYEKEKALILGAIGRNIVAVEHIGSTAVPGLGAKPIIDIMVAVHHLPDAIECIEPLKKIGHEYSAEQEALIPERRYFRKGPSDISNKHYHLHMVEQTSDFWEKHLLFRNCLRAHTNIAQQYYQLKKESAARHGSNREAYTEPRQRLLSLLSRVKAQC